MARLTQELKELVESYVGRFNVDVLTGWEAAMKGQERIGTRLFPRMPPSHFTGQRRHDWYAGHRAGELHRDSHKMRRTVTFAGHNGTESVIVTRKGWGVPRGEVVTQLARKGCYGLVLVSYWQGSKVVRTVNCGI